MSTVAFDLDGTVSANPSYFKAEMEGLHRAGHRVFVLTGNPRAEEELSQLGFVKNQHYDGVVKVPRRHIAKAKVAVMKALGASVLVDNRFKTIRKLQKAGLTGHWVAHPKGKP